jgi:DNA-binding transcriptional LysR family regulator
MKLSCLAVLALLLVLGSFAKAADRLPTSTDCYVYVDGQTK